MKQLIVIVMMVVVSGVFFSRLGLSEEKRQPLTSAQIPNLNLDDFEKLSAGNTESVNKKNVDPFDVPAKDIKIENMRLIGIVYGERLAGCLINHSILLEGDGISGYTVYRIERNRVILKSKNGKEIYLTM